MQPGATNRQGQHDLSGCPGAVPCETFFTGVAPVGKRIDPSSKALFCDVEEAIDPALGDGDAVAGE